MLCDSTPYETGGGAWRFVLESDDDSPPLEVTDFEDALPERLALLAVVRGLEALEGPSYVTLVTGDRYVVHGLRRGLSLWREANFRWEHFGLMRPIQNCDLWRRVDRALGIHEVQVCSFVSSRVSKFKRGMLDDDPRDANERVKQRLMARHSMATAAA